MKKVLQPPRNMRKKEKSEVKTSTPVNSLTEIQNSQDPNLSAISSRSGFSKAKIDRAEFEKENQPTDLGEINSAFIELKSMMEQSSHQFKQQREGLLDINKQINELRGQVEKEKQDVRTTIDTLKEISLIEKRQRVEKECEQLSSSVDAELLQRLEQLTTVVNHERSKLELKNISFIHDEKFKELLSECSVSIREFQKDKDLESINKLGSFLPELEESLQQCNETTQRCAEIIEQIKRMSTHHSALKLIDSKSLV